MVESLVVVDSLLVVWLDSADEHVISDADSSSKEMDVPLLSAVELSSSSSFSLSLIQ